MSAGASAPPPLRCGATHTSIAAPRAVAALSFEDAREELADRLEQFAFFKVTSVSTSTPTSTTLGAHSVASFSGTAVEVVPSFIQSNKRHARRVLFLKKDRGKGIGNVLGVVSLADAPYGHNHPSSQPNINDILIGTVVANNKERSGHDFLLKDWRGGASPLYELARIVRHGTKYTEFQVRDVLRQSGSVAATMCMESMRLNDRTASFEHDRTYINAQIMAAAADDVWMLARLVLYSNVDVFVKMHMAATAAGCGSGDGSLTEAELASVANIKMSLTARQFIETVASQFKDASIFTAFRNGLPPPPPPPVLPTYAPTHAPAYSLGGFSLSAASNAYAAALTGHECPPFGASPTFQQYAPPRSPPSSPKYEPPRSPPYAPPPCQQYAPPRSPPYAPPPCQQYEPPRSPPFAPSSPPCAPPKSPPSSPQCAPLKSPQYVPSSPQYAPLKSTQCAPPQSLPSAVPPSFVPHVVPSSPPFAPPPMVPPPTEPSSPPIMSLKFGVGATSPSWAPPIASCLPTSPACPPPSLASPHVALGTAAALPWTPSYSSQLESSDYSPVRALFTSPRGAEVVSTPLSAFTQREAFGFHAGRDLLPSILHAASPRVASNDAACPPGGDFACATRTSPVCTELEPVCTELASPAPEPVVKQEPDEEAPTPILTSRARAVMAQADATRKPRAAKAPTRRAASLDAAAVEAGAAGTTGAAGTAGAATKARKPRTKKSGAAEDAASEDVAPKVKRARKAS